METTPRAVSPDSLVTLLTVNDVSQILNGLSVVTIRRLIRDRRIASIRIGRSVRIHPVDLARYIEQQRRDAL